MKIKILITTLLLFLLSCEDSSGPSYLDKDELGYFSFEVNGKFWYPKTDMDILMPYNSHFILIVPLYEENKDSLYKMYVVAGNKSMKSYINFPIDSIKNEGKYNIKEKAIRGDYGKHRDKFKFIINDIEYNNLNEQNSWINLEYLSKVENINDFDTVKATFHIECYNDSDTITLSNGFFYLFHGRVYSFY